LWSKARTQELRRLRLETRFWVTSHSSGDILRDQPTKDAMQATDYGRPGPIRCCFYVFRLAGVDEPLVMCVIKSASHLCSFLMHVAPIIFPTSVGSRDP
jgi:hypothetical protein